MSATFPGPTLERLARIAPAQYARVLKTMEGAIPPRITEALASYMELQETRTLLARLRAQGTTEISLLGFSPLVQELLKNGELDAFDIEGIYTDTPPREFYGYAKEDLSIAPLAAHRSGGESRELVADPSLRERFPNAEALPARTHERATNVFFAEDRAAYPELFAPAGKAARKEIQRVFTAGKTILFAGVYTYFNFSRYSIALRKRGWKTVYLCLNKSNTSFRDSHFDAVIHAAGDVELFYSLQGSFDWHAVYFQAWLGLHPFAAAAATLNPGRTFVEFNDLPPYIMSEETFDATFEDGAFQRESEAIRDVMSHSKGTVFNLVQGGGADLLRHAPATGPVRYFHSYPCRDFFASPESPENGAIKIAFAGSVAPSNIPHSVFGDIKLFDMIQELTGQGLTFHMFLNPYQLSEPKGPFWDYFHLAKRNPSFRIHPGVAPEQLPKTLAQIAHYGSMLYRLPHDFEILAKHFETIVPTKFFSYIEAGLPVLINSEFTGLCSLVEKYGLGLAVRQQDIPHLAAILRQTDHRTLCGNVARYREENAMEIRIAELEALLSAAS